MYLLGYDIGSSSIKAALVEANTGKTIQIVQSPQTELAMIAHQPGWAEQDPELWWEHVCLATQKLLNLSKVVPAEIQSIGIAYQMHGLVLVDQDQKVLRPSIIWCDSRAVEIGKKAFENIGQQKCLNHLLNSPGNFTASKLKWVKEHEPELFEKVYKFMLPGDYIAMKLTGEIRTTISGLSEGMFWDFKNNQLADFLLDEYGLNDNLFPELAQTFGVQGRLNQEVAEETGLVSNIPVTYRAGDQPNNALSLGVFHPGEVAATGGTSGVVYGVIDQAKTDERSRVNPFAHVNHTIEEPRLGVLLCINGAGIQYAWLKKQMGHEGLSYDDMEQAINKISVGADGLRILPFGNGAERMLEDQSLGAQVNNLQFNLHTRDHFYRAGLEGIAFSFVYGVQILKDLGLQVDVLKVGNDNLFQSAIFTQTIANLLNCRIEIVATTGAAGAAKASGLAVGVFDDLESAINNQTVKQYTPEEDISIYQTAYQLWEQDLIKHLKDE